MDESGDLYWIGVVAHNDPDARKQGDDYTGFSFTPKNMIDICDRHSELRRTNQGGSKTVYEHEDGSVTGEILLFWKDNLDRLGAIGVIYNQGAHSKELINNIIHKNDQIGLSVGGLHHYNPSTGKMVLKSIMHIGHVKDPLFGSGGTWIKEYSSDPSVIFSSFAARHMQSASYINKNDVDTIQSWWNTTPNSHVMQSNNNIDRINKRKNLSANVLSYFKIKDQRDHITSKNNQQHVLFVTGFSKTAGVIARPFNKMDIEKLSGSVAIQSDNTDNSNTIPLVPSSDGGSKQQTAVQQTPALLSTSESNSGNNTQQISNPGNKDIMDVSNGGGSQNTPVNGDGVNRKKRKAEDQLENYFPLNANVKLTPDNQVDDGQYAMSVVSQALKMPVEQIKTIRTIAETMKGKGVDQPLEDLIRMGIEYQNVKKQEEERKQKEAEQREIEIKRNFAQLAGPHLNAEEKAAVASILNTYKLDPAMQRLVAVATTASARAVSTQQTMLQNVINRDKLNKAAQALQITEGGRGVSNTNSLHKNEFAYGESETRPSTHIDYFGSSSSSSSSQNNALATRKNVSDNLAEIEKKMDSVGTGDNNSSSTSYRSTLAKIYQVNPDQYAQYYSGFNVNGRDSSKFVQGISLQFRYDES